MASIQERLQIKREPLDKWSLREQLCLASAVAKSGDQNWMSVSRQLKPFGEPNRPSDWFHQKNCASQYGSLLENVDTPKRKKRLSGSEPVIETPIETILRKLTKDRVAEIEKCLAEERAEYLKLQEDMVLLQSGNVTEELLDKWCKEIDEEENQKEEEAIAHTQWLQEREIRKQEIERAWRPMGKPAVNLPQKRKLPDKLDTLVDLELAEENQQNQHQETAKPALSPLLTSLLKSPSQVPNVTSSSILHTVMTSQPQRNTSSSIANLLNTQPSSTTTVDYPQPVTQEQASNYVAITHDILEDAVDSIPHIKVEDLESSILSSDDPLPEMKNEEVEVIISDLIQNADVVSDPEQHLQLDDHEDIITNLDNELQELCNEEEAAAAKEAAAVKEAAEAKVVEVEQEPEVVKTIPEVAKNSPEKEEANPPKRDPFEFEEDPEICELTKPSASILKYQEAIDKRDQEEKTVEVVPQEEEAKSENDQQGVSQNSGSVEIVEVVVLEEEEIDKQLNKTQIQDIVHSFTTEVDHSPTKPEPEMQTTDLETKEEPVQEAVQPTIINFDECSIDTDAKSSDTEIKNLAEDSNKTTLDDNLTDNEFTGSFFDDLNMEVNKLDHKAKRDYSRTKKRESEKEFDILLAVEKAVNAQLESRDIIEENSMDKNEEVDKKSDSSLSAKPKIKVELDRSCSPWTEDDELLCLRSKRRYSTPSDSIPNSPASSSVYYEDDRDYRNWKKSVMLVYSRLTTHKFASLFLKPITNEQAPGYHSVVYRPMDLQTIRKNIENGSIRTTLELQRDVLLMFTNAIMYNKMNDLIYKMALQMQQESMQQLDILLQAQMGDFPQRRETRTSEPSSKRKRSHEDNRGKKRKED
ncbi:hypothetical protein PPYR_01887 [Photinus pyralis]|uniref:Bromo domain-containing protein n=1 Tax=Photinus pyralis TaxID=7054 RepID=A0A5N4B5M1_PHOPY|nr:bromodomain-containing protein 8-like [Photinus pyralis]KAB0804917.1 hypothetical protein PPYR_01887 [Photinus pyralis]